MNLTLRVAHLVRVRVPCPFNPSELYRPAKTANIAMRPCPAWPPGAAASLWLSPLATYTRAAHIHTYLGYRETVRFFPFK